MRKPGDNASWMENHVTQSWSMMEFEWRILSKDSDQEVQEKKQLYEQRARDTRGYCIHVILVTRSRIFYSIIIYYIINTKKRLKDTKPKKKDKKQKTKKKRLFTLLYNHAEIISESALIVSSKNRITVFYLLDELGRRVRICCLLLFIWVTTVLRFKL